MNKANVNGKKQDIIITTSYENSEFFKLKKKLPFNVLEYLAVNKYKFNNVIKYLNRNENIELHYINFKPNNREKKFKVLSKFKIDGSILKNLNSNNSNDSSIQLDFDELNLDKHIIKRSNYPFNAIVTLKKPNNDSSFFATNIDFLEAITIDMKEYKSLRKNYTTQEWLNLIFNSIGYDADTLTPFEKYSFLIRLIPFCIEQYHSIELGNKETAKSYFYSIMPGIYSSSISSGNITIPKLVKNNSSKAPGILQTTNVVNFDEITDASLKDKDVLTMLQTYLQDGHANRDNENIIGKASIVFTGNVTNFEESVLNEESLFNHFNADIKNETLFDKLHFFSPGWKLTKINPSKYAKKDSIKIRRDYFLCALNFMREEYMEYLDIFRNQINFKNTESGRDMRIETTIAGLIMLLHPDKDISIEELEAFAYIALTGRKTLLRELQLKNEREYNNSLRVENSETKKEIGFEELSNFTLNISETFLNSHCIFLDDVDYYYLDFYKDYSLTKEINKQYDFKLVEPTIVIKCIGSSKVYKLAMSSYGINMNILEVSEGKTKDNVICRNLTENFMLIETTEVKDNIEKLYFKKLTKSTNTFEKLKEVYKNKKFMSDIIDLLVSEQEKQKNFFKNIKILEKQIENQESKILENNKLIQRMDLILKIKNWLHNISFNLIKDKLMNFKDLLFCFKEDYQTKEYIENLNEIYYLGNNIYNDNQGEYSHLFYYGKLVGKFYTRNNEYILFSQEESEIINNAFNKVDKYIESIDKLFDFYRLVVIADLSFINFYDKDDLEKTSPFDEAISNFKKYISYFENFINNLESITNLNKSLNSRYLISTQEIINQFEVLKKIEKNIDIIIGKTLTSIELDNSIQNLLNDLSNSIFDNNFITKIKNSLI